MVVLERGFPLDHPAAPGHFPGNPIIPGALLLSETLRALETSLDLNLAQGQPVSAKFLHPVRPGEKIRIEYSEAKAGTLKFACAVGATLVMTGTVRYGAAWTPA